MFDCAKGKKAFLILKLYIILNAILLNDYISFQKNF